MFAAGLTGYNVTRGLLGALKSRGPGAALVGELLDAGDVSACVTRLRNLPFVEGIEVGEGPADVERSLRYACWSFARKIRGFLGGSAGRFFAAYCLHYEMHNAKVLFRASLDPGVSDVLGGIYPLSPAYDSALRDAPKSPGDVVKFYEDTPLAVAVGQAFEMYGAHDDDLSLFEMVLDREYAKLVWRAAEQVGPADGYRLRKGIVRGWLGATALLWVLWLARYRRMAVEEIMTLLELPEKIISPDTCMALVEKGLAGAVAGDMRDARLREFLAQGDLDVDVSGLYRLTRRFVWQTISPAGLQVRFDISTLLVALMRWEMVVEDALIVVSSMTIGMGKDEIMPLLVTQAA
ncbi:MAG: V-type ATPase subunit [Planctomycetes bacterium]|nr:V-type ATPase subunit [Planctomycetota bacterium]